MKPLAWLRAVRAHHWTKNVLLFIPVLASHSYTDGAMWISGAIGFISFSLAASAVYLLNDLCDLSHDRTHVMKRDRPLAKGELRAGAASVLSIVLLAASAGLAATLSKAFLAWMGLYLALNCVYVFWGRKQLVLDVVLLAIFYTIRIFAGGAAVSISVSEWLLAFSIFFFLGLAFCKRFIEIGAHPTGSASNGRAYERDDRPILHALGLASAIVSVLVFVLYLNGPEASALYQHRGRLWLVTPILLYWIGRLWILAGRGKVHEDPIVFALMDVPSWITLFTFLGILISARW